jgi:hypothetical protein
MENTTFEKRTSEYRRLLEEVAAEYDVDATLLQELIDYEQTRVHLQRRRGAKADIQQIIEQKIFDTE